MDNTTVIDFTGDTKNAGMSPNFDSLYIAGISNYQNDLWIDDLYLCDDSGAANNTFLGDVRVQTLVPTGAGSSTQFTPTGVANNWDNVNDIPAVTTTYNYSTTVGQRDTYQMSDLIAAPTTVLAVQTSANLRKLDAGAGNIKPALKPASTVYYGSTRALTSSARVYTDVFEINPDTSLPWSASEVNAAEFGGEVA